MLQKKVTIIQEWFK